MMIRESYLFGGVHIRRPLAFVSPLVRFKVLALQGLPRWLGATRFVGRVGLVGAVRLRG